MTSKIILVLATAMMALTIVFASAASVVSASSAVVGASDVSALSRWLGPTHPVPVASAASGVVGAPAVTTRDLQGIDLFVRNATGAILWYHSSDGSTWPTQPVNLGGNATADPAVTTPQINDVLLVFIANDTGVWAIGTFDGGTTWTSWESLGGAVAPGTGPAAVENGVNIGVFCEGTDHLLWWKYTTDDGVTWSSWTSPHGVLTASPAADNPSTTVNNVYVRGGDSAVWQNVYSSGTWLGWTGLYGKVLPSTGPASTNWGPANSHVFVEGTDSHMWYKNTTSAGNWPTAWKAVGTRMSTSPSAVQRSATSIDVFAGNATGIHQTEWNGATWSPWSLAVSA